MKDMSPSTFFLWLAIGFVAGLLAQWPLKRQLRHDGKFSQKAQKVLRVIVVLVCVFAAVGLAQAIITGELGRLLKRL